jgi:hypothetical protein
MRLADVLDFREARRVALLQRLQSVQVQLRAVHGFLRFARAGERPQNLHARVGRRKDVFESGVRRGRSARSGLRIAAGIGRAATAAGGRVVRDRPLTGERRLDDFRDFSTWLVTKLSDPSNSSTPSLSDTRTPASPMCVNISELARN